VRWLRRGGRCDASQKVVDWISEKILARRLIVYLTWQLIHAGRVIVQRLSLMREVRDF